MNKSPYDKSELKQFKSLINKKAKKVKKEYEALKQSYKDQKSYIKNKQDGISKDGSEYRNLEMLDTMKRRKKRKIEKYNLAIDKIKNGTYGICRKTGKPISKKRLMTLPEATTRIK